MGRSICDYFGQDVELQTANEQTFLSNWLTLTCSRYEVKVGQMLYIMMLKLGHYQIKLFTHACILRANSVLMQAIQLKLGVNIHNIVHKDDK